MKKRLIILTVMSLGFVTAAFAGYAGIDQNMLPTETALDYKGEGNLVCNYEYGGCSDPWDEYAICFFGYEAIESVSVEHGGGGGVFCTGGYEPETYIYGGPSKDQLTEYIHTQYGYSDHDYHTETFSNIPVNCRYIKVRFQRTGSAACGSSEVKSVKASRTNSFCFNDGSKDLDDNATVNLTTNVEKEFKIKLNSVKHLTSTAKDVTIQLVVTKGENTADCVTISNKVFNDYESDSGRSGYYNLISSAETSMKVKFPSSGEYGIYVDVSYDGYIVQRKYLNFKVSDN